MPSFLRFGDFCAYDNNNNDNDNDNTTNFFTSCTCAQGNYKCLYVNNHPLKCDDAQVYIYMYVQYRPTYLDLGSPAMRFPNSPKM